MVDEDTDEVADVVLLWWREDDGDLVDALVDAIASLADDGVVWLLVPKSGRPGHVEPGDVTEAAPPRAWRRPAASRRPRTGRASGWSPPRRHAAAAEEGPPAPRHSHARGGTLQGGRPARAGVRHDSGA
jgi:hypothetical protein